MSDGFLERWIEDCKQGEAEVIRLREENESLRAELNDKRLSRYEPAYVGDLEEENERLRERGDWAVEQLRLAEAAGEELREQLSLEEAAKTWRNAQSRSWMRFRCGGGGPLSLPQ